MSDAPPDLAKLTDDDLRAIYAANPPAPQLSSMSDDDLRRLHAQNQAADYGQLANATNTAARWATFGLSDLAAAAGGATGSVIRGAPGTWGENYQKTLARVRGEGNQFSTEHPYENAAAAGAGALAAAAPAMGWPTALKAGGAIPTITAAPTLAGRMGTGALGGAGVGAASGFANSPNGNLQDTLMGAGTGAIVGAGAPLVGELASVPINAFTRRFMGGADTQALDRIANRMTQDAKASGKTLGDVVNNATTQLASAGGKPLSLADVTPENTQALAGKVTRMGGPGREAATNFLGDRSSGMGPRLVGDVDTAFPSQNAFATTQDLMRQRSQNSTPLYDTAYSVGPLHSDRLEQFTNDPIIKQGLAKGMEIQRLEALAEGKSIDPSSYNVAFDLKGEPSFASVAPNKPVDIIEHLIRSGGIKDQGGELAAMDMNLVNKGYFGRLAHDQGKPLDYAREGAEEAGYLPKGSSTNDLLDAIYESTHGRPIYSSQDTHQVANWEQYLKSGELPPQPTGAFNAGSAFDPNDMLKGLPRGWNMQTLDAAKRGLDDILEGYRDSTTGRLVLDQRGRAVDQVRRAYLDELDNLNPDYAAAREAWAGPSAAMGAMKQGQNFRSMRPELIDNMMNGTSQSGAPRMSQSEREFFRVGAADAMRQEVMRTGDPRGIIGSNAANNRGADMMKQQLRPLFDNQADFDKFIQNVSTEALAQATSGKMLGNSATAGRLAEDVGMGHGGTGLMGNAAIVGGSLAAGEPMVAASRVPALFSSLRNAGELAANNPAVNAATAGRLFTSDPQANAATLAAILARARYPSLNQRVALPLAAAAGSNPLIPLRVGGALSQIIAHATPDQAPVQK